MWTAKITKNGMDTQGRVVVDVIYSNGTQNIPESYTEVTPASVSRTITNRLNQLNDIDDFLKTSSTGVFTPPTEALSLAVKPSAEDLAKEKFSQDLLVLKRLQKAVSLGIKKDTDPDVVAQLALVRSEFLADYLDAI